MYTDPDRTIQNVWFTDVLCRLTVGIFEWIRERAK